MTRWALTDRRIQCCLFATATAIAVVATQAHPALTTQLTVLSTLVVVAGLPHGGLDVLIAARCGWLNNPRGQLSFHLAYLALAVVVAALWMLFPGAALCGFLLISAWHFGGDWAVGQNRALRVIAGASLLSLPTLTNLNQVAALYGFLAPDCGAQFAQWQSLLSPAAGIGLFILAAVAARARQWSDALELTVLLLAGLLLPPLVFFAVYFCALHSPRNLAAEWLKSKATALGARITVLIYTSAAAAGMGGMLWWQAGRVISMDASLTRTLFIGLAALTVPHMALAAIARRSERP